MKKVLTIVLVLCLTLSLFIVPVGAEGAPATPENILFTPVTTDSVTITWNAVEGAESYNVYRRNVGQNEMAKIATVTAPTYVDTAVEKAHDYYYSVTAVNAAGESAGTRDAFIMTGGDRAVMLNSFNIKEIAGPACRLRIGDLDGDGRNDILAVNTAQNTSDAYNPRVVWSMTAFNIEGEVIWQWFANPATPKVNSFITKTGSDEPCQILDVDGDGYNEVILVGNPTWNPNNNSNCSTSGDVFYILDGKTGATKFSKSFADAKIGNNLHDCITLANFDGRKINGKSVKQFLVLKERYGNIQVYELFDKDTQEFILKNVWGYNQGTSGQATCGHMTLATDLDGDGKDELLSNYTVLNSDGTVRWKVPNKIVNEAGQQVGTASDHVDTIQVGDVDGNPENGLEVVLGGGGSGMSTFCFDANGKLMWTNNIAKEPQSLILADFRTESVGLELYGLDRRNRSNYPAGHDGLFLIGPKGEDLYKEPDNPQGWSTIVVRVPNWTGTWAPLSLAFYRNDQANNASPTQYPNATDNNWLPAIYDGYFNVLFELPGADARFMVANLVGDARDELVGYTDAGEIWIYSNGYYPLDSLITGKPYPQTDFLGNYSRYPTDKFEIDMTKREPAAPEAENVNGGSAFIDWTPVVGATGYTLYRDGVKIGDFEEIGYQETGLANGTYKYTVTANDGTDVSPVSYPLTLTIEGADGTGASADKASYAVDETITVTATVAKAAEKVYLANENGTGLASTRSVVANGDGTYTWTLTLSLGTVGSRTLSVFADGEDTGMDVSFDIVYPAAAGVPEITSIMPPLTIKANESFTVTFVTNQYAEYVRLFNENGAGLMPSACSYTDNGTTRTWSYTLAVGTAGQRSFTAKAAAADRVFVGDALVNLYVG